MQESASGDNQQVKVTETEKAWLAGIVDGEGSIRIDVPHGKTGASPRVVVTNNDWAIIERVVDIGQRVGANPYVSQRRGKRENTKDVLVLGMRKIPIFLLAILPYLTGQKEKQALLMYRFCEERNKLNVKTLPNDARKYSSRQLGLIQEIKDAKHTVTQPQRLNARLS